MLADLLVSAFFSSIRDVEKQHLLSIEFAGSIRFCHKSLRFKIIFQDTSSEAFDLD